MEKPRVRFFTHGISTLGKFRKNQKPRVKNLVPRVNCRVTKGLKKHWFLWSLVVTAVIILTAVKITEVKATISDAVITAVIILCMQ